MKIRYTTEDIALDLTVIFAPDSGASTLIGGSMTFGAINAVTGAKIEGSATITGADTARLLIAAGSLAAGIYSLQARATPAGHFAQVVYEETYSIAPGV